MDIKEFFDQSCGKWFSQRTNQHLTYAQSDWGKSDVWIEMVSADDPLVLQACQAHNREAATALFGVTVKWEGSLGRDPKKIIGNTVLVPLAGDQPDQGVLLRQTVQPKPILTVCQYGLDAEDVLTIATEQAGMETQERIWFVTPNLRLRTSLLKRPNQLDTTTFCSEIRSAGAK